MKQIAILLLALWTALLICGCRQTETVIREDPDPPMPQYVRWVRFEPEKCVV